MDTDAGWIDGDLLHCTFCGRAQGQSAKLIAGPGVYICDRCVAVARGWPGVLDPERRCDFCGIARGWTGRMAVREGTAICHQCLELCETLIAEERAG